MVSSYMKTPFSWDNIEYPIILCPPMDGITDISYRELVAQMGGSGPRYCEFVNVKGINYESPKTFFELKYTEKQRPVIIQLFGHEPEEFYKAAKTAVKMGFDAIDINMGCPAHKVASKGGGCALMGDLENAKKIVEETIRGANEAWREISENFYEVTTKMRLGVCDKHTVFEHGMAMIEAGSKAVAIHGRTLKQMYTGEADWEPIKEFKRQVDEKFAGAPWKPKVFGSGDVKSLYDAFVRLVTTGVDGIMIGRGSFGNPWIFDKERVKICRDLVLKYGWPKPLNSIDEIPEKELSDIKDQLGDYKPTFEEVKNMAIHHSELMLKDKGEKGIIQMRKHLAWYFTGFDGAKELRGKLVLVNTLNDIKRILNEFKMSIY
jgi:tRNA-dihydrouridine synthase B